MKAVPIDLEICGQKVPIELPMDLYEKACRKADSIARLYHNVKFDFNHKELETVLVRNEAINYFRKNMHEFVC